MSAETRLTLARTRETRDRVIAALQEHFAHDELDVDEFERRVTVAHTSSVPAEIEALLADMPALEGGAEAAPMTTALARASEIRPTDMVTGIMSATRRTGPWTVPRRLRVRGIMSSTILDFREARFPPGPVDLDVRAIMSSVEIIVPPGLAVETHGSAIMGAFDEIERTPVDPDPEAPLLRIRGSAIMGAVEVKMRLPGESDRDGYRRQRIELRQARQRQRLTERHEDRELRRLERAERHRR